MPLTQQQRKALWICGGLYLASYPVRWAMDYSRQVAFYQAAGRPRGAAALSAKACRSVTLAEARRHMARKNRRGEARRLRRPG